MLSAHATDRSVNQATSKLFPIANTPSDILALGEAGLKPILKSINHYPTKTRYVLKTCELLCGQFKGQVPNTREGLESLPGVGRKTANVILNTAFEESIIAVDTHIFRVANRTKLATGKTPREVEDKLMRHVGEEFRKDAHHWLVLHGRYICKAPRPKCSICPIVDLCEYKDKIY